MTIIVIGIVITSLVQLFLNISFIFKIDALEKTTGIQKEKIK